jgi:hypothetical protein
VDVCPDGGNKSEISISSSHKRSSSRGLSLPIPPPPPNPPQKYSMPLPVMAMMGQSTGKLKVREFSVCPLPCSTVPQQMKMLDNIYYELGKVLATKLGVSIYYVLHLA